MRAIWYECGGAAEDVLQLGEFDIPEPCQGAVRVRVAFSAVNPYDTKKRIDAREAEKWGRIIPHADGSGEIDAVGAGVPAQRIGEKVWLFGAQVSQAHGTCAEFCVVPAWKAIRLPDGVSLEHGACLGVPAVTAVEALNAGGSVANKRVLVAGGAGRVGAYAVQFARACGAHVTATASARDCASVEQMGASRCFDYTDPELVRNLRDDSGKRGYDLIIEPRFGTNIALDARVLSRGGVIAAYGFDDNPSPVMPALPLVMNNAVCRFIGIFALHRAAQEAALEQVCRLTEQPGIEHRVGLQVALTEAAQAHQRIETGQVAGAALICI